ncbi:MAG: SAM-dependent methyltransferase [Rhodospirillaceae bacterium]
MLALQAVRRSLASGAVALAALMLANTAMAAQASVPYVPTPQEVVERMLDMAKVGPHDYLIDLGSGDGRIVITAAKKFGTRGYGVDLNPQRVKEANENARKAGVADKVSFYERDLFETDLSQASVITMYLLPKVNLMLRPKLLDLKPGTRIVSHDFSMDEWQPEQHVSMPAPDKYGGAGGTSDIYLWIVPAKLAGTWRWEIPLRSGAVRYELQAQQRYQIVTGTVTVGERRVPLEGVKLTGDHIAFAFTTEVGGAPVKHLFSGKVAGSAITGTVELSGPRLHSEQQWEATKAQQ